MVSAVTSLLGRSCARFFCVIMKRTAVDADLDNTQHTALTEAGIPPTVLEDLPPEIRVVIAQKLGTGDLDVLRLRAVSTNWASVIDEAICAPVKNLCTAATKSLRELNLVAPEPNIRRSFSNQCVELKELLTEDSASGRLRQISDSTGVAFFTVAEVDELLRKSSVFNIGKYESPARKRAYLLSQGPAVAAHCYAAWNIMSALAMCVYTDAVAIDQEPEEDASLDAFASPLRSALVRGFSLWASKNPLEPLYLVIPPTFSTDRYSQEGVEDLLRMMASTVISAEYIAPHRFPGFKFLFKHQVWNVWAMFRQPFRCLWEFWFRTPPKLEFASREVQTLKELELAVLKKFWPHSYDAVREVFEEYWAEWWQHVADQPSFFLT